MQEHWPVKASPAKFEEAQRILQNNTKSWRKTSYDKNRTKRSTTKTYTTPYPEINILLTTVAIAFICIAIVILGGYIERKTREARNARYEYQRATCEEIREKYESTRGAMQDFHRIATTKTEQVASLIQEKMEMLIKIYQESLRQNALNSPYPIKLTGGHFNEDFATIARIIHWNGQWRDDSNTSLLPSSFVICPHNLPEPVTPNEWGKHVRKFYEESGMTLEVANEDIDVSHAEILDVDNLGKEQMCTTPVCIKPDLKYEGKKNKCHYCNGICCNCMNCQKYRAFFQIRTALINTGKIDRWDYLNMKMEKQVLATNELVSYDQRIKKIVKKLYEKAKLDDPELPMSMDQLPLVQGSTLRRKLKKIAARMMEGPMIKLLTGDERLNEMTDELTNQVVEHFLEQQGIISSATRELMRWVTKNYHHPKKAAQETEAPKKEDEEKTKGGSGVTVRVDCNTSLAAQEEEPSDCDSDEHSITDLGYNVIETDEKMGENSFSYVYDD